MSEHRSFRDTFFTIKVLFKSALVEEKSEVIRAFEVIIDVLLIPDAVIGTTDYRAIVSFVLNRARLSYDRKATIELTLPITPKRGYLHTPVKAQKRFLLA